MATLRNAFLLWRGPDSRDDGIMTGTAERKTTCTYIYIYTCLRLNCVASTLAARQHLTRKTYRFAEHRLGTSVQLLLFLQLGIAQVVTMAAPLSTAEAHKDMPFGFDMLLERAVV